MLPQTAPIPSFLWPLKLGGEGQSSSQPWNVTGDQGPRCRALHQGPAAFLACLPACLCCKLAHRIFSGRAQDRAKPPSRAVKIELFLPILDETDTNFPRQPTAQALR